MNCISEFETTLIKRFHLYAIWITYRVFLKLTWLAKDGRRYIRISTKESNHNQPWLIH